MKIDFAMVDFGKDEVKAVNRVLKTNWLASGKENTLFEEEFAKYVGTKYAVCVNSGSSANLIALASLNLPKGSKVLTSACGFPATFGPILHLGLKPVLVDYDDHTLNISIDQVLEKIPGVDAIIFAHTLGNPVEMRKILAYAARFGVKVIEDCCEAAGSFLDGQSVGSYGDIGTFSFYPSHQITAGGGGGMITTNSHEIANVARSLRDWGKLWNWNDVLGDNKTFYNRDIGLDYYYYQHYCYQTIGYNMKLPEMNAAFGRVQLKRLNEFTAIRNENYKYLANRCPKAAIESENSSISWFGFPMRTLNRNKFGDYLESSGIRHRPFFAGNITRHKPYSKYFSEFYVADRLMRDCLFVGCHTKLTKKNLDYMVKQINDFDDFDS